MRRLAGRLAFVHRTLWQRGHTYRWAALLGPPPLLGCALAALALAAWDRLPHAAPASGADAPWASWSRPVPSDGQPYVEAPAGPLPQTDASGGFVGFQPGWKGGILPITVDATMDVDVSPSAMAGFTIDGPVIPLARILDAGPQSGLFVGANETWFVVRSPGLYAFSARLVWSGAQTADCMVRLGTARHRLVRNLNLKIASRSTINYAPTEFRLEPGLLPLKVAAGCWRGDRMAGPGTVTIMVRRPGEADLTPAAADELIRPARTPTAGGDVTSRSRSGP